MDTNPFTNAHAYIRTNKSACPTANSPIVTRTHAHTQIHIHRFSANTSNSDRVTGRNYKFDGQSAL